MRAQKAEQHVRVSSSEHSSAGQCHDGCSATWTWTRKRRYGAGARVGAWSFCTWSDADIGDQLAAEFRTKGRSLHASISGWT